MKKSSFVKISHICGRIATQHGHGLRVCEGDVGKSLERQRRNYDDRAGALVLEEGATVNYFHPLKKRRLSLTGQGCGW